MTRTIRLVGLAAATLLLGTGVAHAQDVVDDGWYGEAILSFAAQTGTIDTVSGVLDVKGGRDWDKESVNTRFLGSYGTSKESIKGGVDDENTIQDSQALLSYWKHSFTDRFFFNTQNEISRDSTQDRNLRFALSTGPGVRMWQGADSAAEHFDTYLGVGYRHEIYDGNANTPGVSKSNDNFADGVIGFEYKNGLFDNRLEYTHTASAKMPFNNINAYVLRTEVLVGVPLAEAWSLNLGFLAEYTKVTTDPNDELVTRTTVGVGYKF